MAAFVTVGSLGCEPSGPSASGPTVPTCPDRMALIPGMEACIDRYEVRVQRGTTVPARGELPTDALSWQDADRLCRTSGFRLCTRREWQRACGGRDARTFPYGTEHEPGRCNDATFEEGVSQSSLEPGGARTGCVTPEGVYDLAGNLGEWLSDTDASGDLRETIGGSFGTPESYARCTYQPSHQPTEEAWSGQGVRCCVDATQTTSR